MTGRGVKVRAGDRWTESRFWSHIRTHLRKAMKNWPPRRDAANAAIVGWKSIPKKTRSGKIEYYKIGENKGKPKQQKVAIRECSICQDRYSDDEKMIEINHKIPCGSLKSSDDLKGFVERGFCEVEGFEAVCKPCHKEITAEERKRKKEEKENE